MGLNLTNSFLQNEISELEPGNTIRVNHSDCPAGEDTRRRLYITRVQAKPDKVVAYCHNCQDSGVSISPEWEPYRRDQFVAMGQSRIEMSNDNSSLPPKGLIQDPTQWPVLARQWQYRNSIFNNAIEMYNICYDPSSDRIYLPRWNNDKDKELMGYQLRKLRRGSGPKYLTASFPNDKGFTLLRHGNPDWSTTIVLVEDLISGIKIRRAGYSAVINYGIKTNIEALYACAGHDRFYVWLDNDSPHVERQAQNICGTWGLISGTEGKVIYRQCDPKHLLTEDIQGEIARG